MIGEYKGIFHSTLARFGEAFVTIKSDIKQSKNAGKPDYVVVEHEGEDQFLNLENSNCADALRGMRGKSVTIRASGTKGNAKIEVLNADGSTVAPAAPPARSASKAGSGQPTDPAQVAAQWKQAAALALKTAHELKAEHDKAYEETPMKPEQFQALTSGALIYFDRENVIRGMPGIVKKDEEPKHEEPEW